MAIRKQEPTNKKTIPPTSGQHEADTKPAPPKQFLSQTARLSRFTRSILRPFSRLTTPTPKVPPDKPAPTKHFLSKTTRLIGSAAGKITSWRGPTTAAQTAHSIQMSNMVAGMGRKNKQLHALGNVALAFVIVATAGIAIVWWQVNSQPAVVITPTEVEYTAPDQSS